jgi:hypothetical protein
VRSQRRQQKEERFRQLVSLLQLCHHSWLLISILGLISTPGTVLSISPTNVVVPMKKQDADGLPKKEKGVGFARKQQIAPLSSSAPGNGVGFALDPVEIDSPDGESSSPIESPQKDFKIMEDEQHAEMDRKASKRSRLSSITFRRRRKTRRWSEVQRAQMEEKNNPFNQRIMAIADGSKANIIMAFITLFSLFGDDIRLGLTDKSADDAFFGCFTVCFVLFTAEFMVFSWVKPGYRWGFYFALDIIATLSIVPDIGWWWDEIQPSESQTSSSSTSNDELTATRLGRLSRVGTRAGRMVRILRMVRLVRIAKLIGYASKRKHGTDDAVVEEGVGNPSHVGKRMTELTTRRMIILVLVMLLLFPLFDLFMDETIIGERPHHRPNNTSRSRVMLLTDDGRVHEHTRTRMRTRTQGAAHSTQRTDRRTTA